MFVQLSARCRRDERRQRRLVAHLLRQPQLGQAGQLLARALRLSQATERKAKRNKCNKKDVERNGDAHATRTPLRLFCFVAQSKILCCRRSRSSVPQSSLCNRVRRYTRTQPAIAKELEKRIAVHVARRQLVQAENG